MTVFVLHARPRVDPNTDPSEWPLDGDAIVAAADLAAKLPALPIVSSEELKARETAMAIGNATTDVRLGEVRRPWTDDLKSAVVRYLHGEELEGWEPQRRAVTRFASCVNARRNAVYVTHGTVLSLYLSSVLSDFDPVEFWAGLEFLDAWALEDGALQRIGAGGAR